MVAIFLNVLHRYPVSSISLLFTTGMVIIFFSVIYLSDKINKKLAIEYVEAYIIALEAAQTMYSSKIVAPLKSIGITPSINYHKEKTHIPLPSKFSIELAKAMTNPKEGITTKIYSDYPFLIRKDEKIIDNYGNMALNTFRLAKDKTQPFIRFEKINNRTLMRYSKAIVMKQSCVNCHNTHPASPKKDWKIGNVRGVREVVFPLNATHHIAYSEWSVFIAIILSITIFILGILFLAVNALRNSISLLSKTNKAYNRFVPHEFLSYLKKDSIIDVNLSDSVEKKMTVLFSDIRGFTKMCEKMTPEENFIFVNSYYSMLGPVVRQNNGFIDKYIGDAIMALFDNADHAVCATIEMLTTLKIYNEKRLKKKQQVINIGVGLHSGFLRLGTVGEENRMDGTVISDTVNVSSRIEGLTRLYGIEILITETVFQNLKTPHQFFIRPLDRVQVKGREIPIYIYEVFSGDPEPIRTLKFELMSDFASAIADYQAKKFAQAKQKFTQYLAQLPNDEPAKLYIERCKHYLLEGVPDNWNGTFIIHEK